MYTRRNFRNINGNILPGKVIMIENLIDLLKKRSSNHFLNVNDISGNINVFDGNLNQIGWIDIAEEEYRKMEI